MRKPVPPRIRACRRKGQCFILAAKAALAYPTWTLVHGRAALVRSVPGLHMAHAWLEKDGYVYDPVEDQIFKRSQYKREFRAVAERRYKAEGRLPRLLLRYGTWGPWHFIPDISYTV